MNGTRGRTPLHLWCRRTGGDYRHSTTYSTLDYPLQYCLPIEHYEYMRFCCPMEECVASFAEALRIALLDLVDPKSGVI